MKIRFTGTGRVMSTLLSSEKYRLFISPTVATIVERSVVKVVTSTITFGSSSIEKTKVFSR